MKKFLKAFAQALWEGICNVGYFILKSLYPVSRLLVFCTPYAMYFLAGGRVWSSELLIPLIVFVVAYLLKGTANKMGKGDTCPVPEKRFTAEDDGEVTVDKDRLQEMILYVADVEDYLQRKGLL